MTIDASTSDYVHQIRNEPVLGPGQEVIGTVSRLLPNRFIADIRVGPKRYVRVHLNPADFDKVRYQSERGSPITFKGRPRYRLGSSVESFREFEADGVAEIGEAEEI